MILTYLMTGWGERIRKSRAEIGLSQKGLGEAVAKSQSTINDWEHEASQPSLDDFQRLGEALNKTAVYLAFGDEASSPQPRYDREAMRKVIAAVDARTTGKLGKLLRAPKTPETRASTALLIYEMVTQPGSDPATLDRRIERHLDLMLNDAG